MIILPGHHSERSRTATREDLNELATGPAELKLEANTKAASTTVEGNPETRDTPDPPLPTTTPIPKIVPGDSEEYGAELGKDARFWKTYVKEADQWDAELVDGWNKSLDVILIFAALFSAISTAFVIESAKDLQSDPTEASAQSLLLISQTLLVISGTNKSAFSAPAVVSNTNFTPSTATICVNVLWFLSLSLSVAVSLVAMLAKEWCYSYMSGRTGHPCQQARRRQQRWDGLVRWKMQELLIFLPSLIHMALLLFAIGLSIYLWNIHFGVALPVLVITTISLGLYTLSTILPLLYVFCPYNTTLSRLLGRTYQTLFPGTRSSTEEESPKQDEVTSRALHWLIVNCEVPSSVDTALQAIAGATESLPKQLLKECDAAMLICRRLTASSSYVGNYRRAISLYTRALAFLQSEFHSPTQTDDKSLDNTGSGRLEVMVWHMQSKHERDVVDCLGYGNFSPTAPNLNALRVGSTAASHCLRIFNNRQDDTTVVELAASLLEEHLRAEVKLHPAALLALVKATAMLFSCALPPAETSQLNAFPTRLVRVLFAHRHSRQTAYFIGVILSAYALSQRDYPGWKLKPPLDRGSRAERALEMIEYHASLEMVNRNTTPALLVFGLLELLRHCEPDKAAEDDYSILLTASTSLLRGSKDLHAEYVHTIPWPYSGCAPDQQISDILAPSMFPALGLPQAGTIPHDKARVGMYLRLLQSRPPHSPSILVYAFTVESLCRVDSIPLKRTCANLLMTFDTASSSGEGLDEVLSTRNVPALLFHATMNSSPHDHRTALFAMSQLWQHVIRTQQLNLDLELQVAEVYLSRHSSPIDSENTAIRSPTGGENIVAKHLLVIFLSIIKDVPVGAYMDIKDSNILGLMLEAYPDSDTVRFTYASVLLRRISFVQKNRRERKSEVARGRFKDAVRHVIAMRRHGGPVTRLSRADPGL